MSEFPEQDVRAIRDIHHHWLSEERSGEWRVAVVAWNSTEEPEEAA